MNKTIYIIMAVVCLGFASCADDWDDHYNPSTASGGTLWQAIEQADNLKNFASVVKACGYDVILNGSQTYSVFAPVDASFSKEEADQLIAQYQEQKSAGVRANENTVVRQFLQNHIALYKYPISSLTADTITMMNDKYAPLTASTLSDRRLLTKNELASNGLLFTIDEKLSYFPNVFEYLGHDAELDSVYQFLNSHSVYEFDEARSVPGEIVDGLTTYLDSVSVLRNDLLNQLGLINSEDSTYWMVAPTNEEWSRLLTEYEPYFNYANNVAKRDSMVYTQTRAAILGGTFFSRTNNPETAFADSALSTQAKSSLMRQLLGETEAYYLFKKPFDEGGVFNGTEDIVCSNGHVRKAHHLNISKFNTFLQTIKVEAEDVLYQDTLIDAVDPLIVHQVTSDNPFYGQVSGNAFVEVAPINPTAKVTVGFKIPNLLSNVPYNIYAVFVPSTAADTLDVEDTRKPNIVLSNIRKIDQNGVSSNQRFRGTKKNNPAVVDTVEMATNVKLVTCSMGLSEPQVKFEIQSNVQSNQTATNSTTLRLDCIIFKPTELTEK